MLTPEGLTYEADPRHCDLLMSSLNLTEANSVSSPGVKPSDRDDMAVKVNEIDVATLSHENPDAAIAAILCDQDLAWSKNMPSGETPDQAVAWSKNRTRLSWADATDDDPVFGNHDSYNAPILKSYNNHTCNFDASNLGSGCNFGASTNNDCANNTGADSSHSRPDPLKSKPELNAPETDFSCVSESDDVHATQHFGESQRCARSNAFRED